VTVLWLLPSSYCFSCSNSHCLSGWVHQESFSWFLIHVGRMDTRLSWDVGGTMRSEAVICHGLTGSCSAGHFLEEIVVQNWVLPIVCSWYLCASSRIVGASIPNKPVYLQPAAWQRVGRKWQQMTLPPNFRCSCAATNSVLPTKVLLRSWVWMYFLAQWSQSTLWCSAVVNGLLWSLSLWPFTCR